MTDKEIIVAAIKKHTGLVDILLLERNQYFDIIFSHKFAKAFWGEELTQTKDMVIWSEIAGQMKAWEYHLQQMVLEKNPIKYLEKFLTTK